MVFRLCLLRVTRVSWLNHTVCSGRQRELFKPFHRLIDVDPTDGLSSGLGLSLARQIITSAGGQLWFEDRKGGGARFIIELPQASA